MSLHPTIPTVQSIRDNIYSVMQNHALPSSMRAALIGPQLGMVNEWSDQITLVLDHSEAPAPVNLVFAIRKELFIAPQYTQCLLNIPATELPSAFPAFLAMILKLIGAQKTDKEKPVVKVPSPSPLCRIDLLLNSLSFSSQNDFLESSLKPQWILTTTLRFLFPR